MSGIEIPDEAVDAAHDIRPVLAYQFPEEIDAMLRAAAPLIVAAHLRRLARADELSNLCDPYGGTTGLAVNEWLRAEADELDGAA